MSFNARAEYPQTNDEQNKLRAAANDQIAFKRSTDATASTSALAMVANHGNHECLRRNADATCSLSFKVTRPEICAGESLKVYLVSSVLRI